MYRVHRTITLTVHRLAMHVLPVQKETVGNQQHLTTTRLHLATVQADIGTPVTTARRPLFLAKRAYPNRLLSPLIITGLLEHGRYILAARL